jgi:hypothetical protein
VPVLGNNLGLARAGWRLDWLSAELFFAFFCLEGTFGELLARGGLWEAAFGDGLGDAFDNDGDLPDTWEERLRPLAFFFLGLLLFFFCTFDEEVSTAAADF